MPILAVAVFSLWKTVRRWGGVGLFALGIVDSSPIPTFGSLDALTVVLAARHKDLWLYYAGMSTLGAAVGAYLTYRLGLRAGQAGLERRFGATRMERLHHHFDRWGFGAIFVPAIVPPPFPTTLFFAGAGAFKYPVEKFVAAAAAARILRYGAFAYLGAHLGRRVTRYALHYFRHPQKYLGKSLAITAAVILVAVLASIIWRRMRDAQAAEQIRQAESK